VNRTSIKHSVEHLPFDVSIFFELGDEGLILTIPSGGGRADDKGTAFDWLRRD
jgi:hypothetical protein